MQPYKATNTPLTVNRQAPDTRLADMFSRVYQGASRPTASGDREPPRRIPIAWLDCAPTHPAYLAGKANSTDRRHDEALLLHRDQDGGPC